MRVVFDFGAVLFRWRPAVVVSQCWPHRAGSAAELNQTVATLFQGYGGDWGDFDLGLIDADETAARIHQRTGWPELEVRQLIDAVPAELQPQPAVLSLLLQLKARRQLCSFLSNMPKPYASALEAANPLRAWFESGLFSGREQLSKPDPRLFARAAERFGTAPGACLLIDDHPANVEAAKACGWQAHLFKDASGLRAALKAQRLIG
jgi:putative hydrolase of the HAD superfamily